MLLVRFWMLLVRRARKLWQPARKEKRHSRTWAPMSLPHRWERTRRHFHNRWKRLGCAPIAMAANLEDYALIGDCQSAARVSAKSSALARAVLSLPRLLAAGSTDTTLKV